MEWIEVVKDIICSVGFPIVVTGFLLWERTNTMTKLTETINANTSVIERLIDKLDD